jgi:hypothetical protein
VRHEGSSVHVSESLIRGGIGHPGSNPSAETPPGNRHCEALGDVHAGGQAKLWAVTKVNPEQASKDQSRVPTHRFYGEGHANQRYPSRLWSDPPGYGEQHAAKVAGST